MSCSPKWDVNDAITPPARSQRLPPVDGRASDLTRVGSSEFHRPSKRTISVCASARFQSIRSRAAVLSVPRSPRAAGTLTGTPVAASSVRKRAAESGLTPSRSSVAGSAVASDGRAWSFERTCSAPNRNSRSRTTGPPIPSPIWVCVYPWLNGDAVTPPQARSEEHTSELQSRRDLVCRLLLEKKKKNILLFLFLKKKKKKNKQ